MKRFLISSDLISPLYVGVVGEFLLARELLILVLLCRVDAAPSLGDELGEFPNAHARIVRLGLRAHCGHEVEVGGLGPLRKSEVSGRIVRRLCSGAIIFLLFRGIGYGCGGFRLGRSGRHCGRVWGGRWGKR